MASLFRRRRSDSGVVQGAQVGAAVVLSLALTAGVVAVAPDVGGAVARNWICHLNGSGCGGADGGDDASTRGTVSIQSIGEPTPGATPTPSASANSCPPVTSTEVLPAGRSPEETAAIRGNAAAAVRQTGGTVAGLAEAARRAGAEMALPGGATQDLTAFDGLDGTVTVSPDGQITTTLVPAAGVGGCGAAPGQLALPAWIARGLAGAAGVAAWLTISGGLTWGLTPTIGPEEAAIWGNRIGLFFLGFLPPILTPVFEGRQPDWTDAVYAVVGGVIASLSTYWPAALPRVVDGFTWVFQRLVTVGGRLGSGLQAVGRFAGDVAAALRERIAGLPCCSVNPAPNPQTS